MRDARAVAAVLLLSLGLLAATARAESGWATSPIVTIPSPDYSVYGPQPDCEGAVLVGHGIQRTLGPFGTVSDADGLVTHSPLARTVGDVLNRVGMGTVLQSNAVCAEICAVVPHDATRITSLVGYVADADLVGFRPVVFGRRDEYFYWEPEVDTTRLTDEGRLVCTRVRNWLQFERRAFLVVGYER
ncbi:hypothetical protein BH23DEI1_BH23DEI1_23830 [soil metagenome]